MKNLLFIPFVITVILSACTKNDLAVDGPAASPGALVARKHVDFNYHLTKDEHGEWYCPQPKVDCSKVSPNPTLSIDEAIDNNKVTAFFNSPDWNSEFPYLAGQDAVIAGLQDGLYSMVRQQNSSGDKFYLVVPFTTDAANFQPDAVVYATMMTH
jgi:hypothetical protein